MLPRDTESLRIDRQGMGVVHHVFSITGDWEFRQITGRDFGTDCEIELIENNQCTGHSFNVQVKSTGNIERYKNKSQEYLSVSIEISTVNYWLNKPGPFLLLLVNVFNSDIYYIEVKDYLNTNPQIKAKLTKNQETVTFRIPIVKQVRNNFEELKLLVHN